MRVAILGAGVVGISTAWHLRRDGHAVVVIDRAAAPANFSSFANAGCIGAGYAFAWGSPRAVPTMLRSLRRRDQMVRIKPSLSPEFWDWIRRFRRECTAERAAANTKAMARLCAYSQTVLRETVAETEVSFDRRPGGLIYFFRSPESFARASAGAALLEAGGVAIERVDGAGVHARLGALAGPASAIAGGLYAPNDESGDARLYTIGLAAACRAAGVELRLGETIRSLVVESGRVVGVQTDRGRVAADAVVVSLGVYSRRLLRPHLRPAGLDVPIHPVKGYSLTVPVEPQHRPPAMGGVDVDAGLAFAPMGRRFRMTRTLHFAGYDARHRPADFRVLIEKARAAFPESGDFAQPLYWAGFRPMTPTGLPVIDRAPLDGLWINTGQGNFGWTMAAGSARILADKIGGRTPAIPTDEMKLGA